MHRVVHFEIAVDDPERALKFYSDVFGWQAQKYEGAPGGYWLITTGDDTKPGINGGLFKRQAEMCFKNNVNTVDVPSVDDFVARIEEHGGKLAMPKTPIPGHGYFAYCIDPEGNTFGVIEQDASAK